MTTSTGVAVRNGHASAALAIRPGQEMFSDKQKAALAVLGIKDATNADLAVYMHYCQKTGLDPFSRQIYMILRREKQGDQWVAKQTIQVGIDGFRVIRDRIARREGITVEYEDTIWYDASGEPYGVWLFDDEPPTACKVTIIKDGRRFPGVVRTAAYMARNKQGDPAGQWKTQPDHMIEKCAEAFALRRAFPHDLGGMYIDEETATAPPEMPARPARVTAAEITGQQAPAAGDDTRSRSASRSPQGEHERAAGESTAREDDHPRAAGAAPSRGAQPTPPQAAGRAAVQKLDKLLGQLQLGPEEDVRALLEHLCGAPYEATRSQVQLVTGILEDHLEAVQGDTAEAASAVWRQYQAATAQDSAEGSQEEHGGSSDGGG